MPNAKARWRLALALVAALTCPVPTAIGQAKPQKTELWFVIRHYGVEGLRHHIRRHVALAQEFAGWVKESPDFELTAPAPLNLVCFAHRAGDDFNRRLLARLNQTGKLYLTHTVLNGRYTLRLCVGQTHTEAAHVRQAWDLIRHHADLLQA